MTTKRALSRLDTSPTTSDVMACTRCGYAVTGRRSIILGGKWSSQPVCPRCHTLVPSRPKQGDPPPPTSRVVVVKRSPKPAETGTGLRAKLAARNLAKWAERDLS